MQLDRKEIMDAAFNNDNEKITATLDMLGLFKDKPCTTFASTHREITALILNSIAISSLRFNLKKDFGLYIIDRIAPAIDIFSFTHLVVLYRGIRTKDFELIPRAVVRAMEINSYVPWIGYKIADMDESAFVALLAYIDSGAITSSRYIFTGPIIRHIYEKRIILSDSLVFTFMASALRRADDEIFSFMIT